MQLCKDQDKKTWDGQFSAEKFHLMLIKCVTYCMKVKYVQLLLIILVQFLYFIYVMF